MTKTFSDTIFEQCKQVTEVYQTGVRTALSLHHREVDALRKTISDLEKENHGLRETIKSLEERKCES
jgi:hypothetical protein